MDSTDLIKHQSAKTMCLKWKKYKEKVINIHMINDHT